VEFGPQDAALKFEPKVFEKQGSLARSEASAATDGDGEVNDGDSVIVVPSRGGGPRNPFWFENAVAEPAVRFGRGAYRAAVVADETEQARLWGLAERFYPPNVTYREHAMRSGRRIPLLELRPR